MDSVEPPPWFRLLSILWRCWSNELYNLSACSRKCSAKTLNARLAYCLADSSESQMPNRRTSWKSLICLSIICGDQMVIIRSAISHKARWISLDLDVDNWYLMRGINLELCVDCMIKRRATKAEVDMILALFGMSLINDGNNISAMRENFC